ncbi:CRISPR-associated protein Csx15 [Syntrophomonas wolfei]|uniref:CRISPR-associated protein Csx15 n=1 Tax=Syntrophomonas wolfei TaxID=863 RepID=UPI00059C9267|nr:CRISPR-associated protein Csx15 [Syntrophomonas wolfei]
MILLNYAHPITSEDIEKINHLTEKPLTEIRDINAQIDPQIDVITQIEAMLDNAGLNQQEWQTMPILINLPSLNYSTAILLAMLHGRMGYFPAILRMKPEPETIPPRFVVAEIINLRALREKARKKR